MWIRFYLPSIRIWFGFGLLIRMHTTLYNGFFEFGRFDRERWRKNWHSLFDDYDLIHNNCKTIKIEVTSEGDGAFAVVDIDTHWRHKVTGEDFPWKGRVCKIYTKMPNGDWKIIFQTGALRYPPRCHQEKQQQYRGYHLSNPQVIYHCIKVLHMYCNLTRRASIGV